MKKLKKIASVALALVMAMALMVPAFAQTSDSGKGGEGTLTITNAVNGETYEIYKLFDAELNADGSGVIYPSTQTIPSGLSSYFVIDSQNPNTIKATFDNYNETILGALKSWTEGETAYASERSNGTALTFTGLEYGYYVVVSRSGNSNGGAISVDSTNPDATLIDKNESGNIPEFPTDGKEVTAINGTPVANKDDQVTVKVGDLVEYTVKYNTKNYIPVGNTGIANQQVKQYVLTDVKPAFLENFNVKSVTIGGTPVNPTPAFDTDGKMTFDWATKTNTLNCVDPEHHNLPGGVHGDLCYVWNPNYADGAQIVITYEARVNENVIGATAKTNTVSGQPYTVSGQGQDGKTDTETEDVYSYNFELVKTDGDSTTLLAGAKFELYDALTGGNKINLVSAGANTYRVATKDEADATGFTSAVIATNATSKITIQGLSNGTYYLEETEAPAGYNELTARSSVIINGQNNTSTLENDAYNGGAVIANYTGATLPSTGGMGTTLFYAIGGVLLAGSAILFVTKKRMGE